MSISTIDPNQIDPTLAADVVIANIKTEFANAKFDLEFQTTIDVGSGHTITGSLASITGGSSKTASGNQSHVGGGDGNQSTGSQHCACPRHSRNVYPSGLHDPSNSPAAGARLGPRILHWWRLA